MLGLTLGIFGNLQQVGLWDIYIPQQFHLFSTTSIPIAIFIIKEWSGVPVITPKMLSFEHALYSNSIAIFIIREFDSACWRSTGHPKTFIFHNCVVSIPPAGWASQRESQTWKSKVNILRHLVSVPVAAHRRESPPHTKHLSTRHPWTAFGLPVGLKNPLLQTHEMTSQ